MCALQLAPFLLTQYNTGAQHPVCTGLPPSTAPVTQHSTACRARTACSAVRHTHQHPAPLRRAPTQATPGATPRAACGAPQACRARHTVWLGGCLCFVCLTVFKVQALTVAAGVGRGGACSQPGRVPQHAAKLLLHPSFMCVALLLRRRTCAARASLHVLQALSPWCHLCTLHLPISLTA